MYNLNMNQKCKIRIYIINIYGQCFLCTTSMLRFLFVFPAVITVGIAISIQRYHVTLFIQFRNDHYHVIKLLFIVCHKLLPVIMLVKVFTLLLSFSYVISDGQVRQVSFKIYWVLNMLNVIITMTMITFTKKLSIISIIKTK